MQKRVWTDSNSHDSNKRRKHDVGVSSHVEHQDPPAPIKVKHKSNKAPNETPFVPWNRAAYQDRDTLYTRPQKNETTSHDKRPWTYSIANIKRMRPYLPAPTIPDPDMEQTVFTHRSISQEQNYERLEFLGDAYLEIIASRLLYARFPTMKPASMSRIREYLVRNTTLEQFSIGYGFDKRLRVAQSETQGAENKRKVNGDVFEAYCSAVILSNAATGYQACEAWLSDLWDDIISNNDITNSITEHDGSQDKLARDLTAPDAKLEYRQVAPPRPAFYGGGEIYRVGVFLTGWGFDDEQLGTGEGESMLLARDAAARDAMKHKIPSYQTAAERKLEYVEKVNEQNVEAAGLESSLLTEAEGMLLSANNQLVRTEQRLKDAEDAVARFERMLQSATHDAQRQTAEAELAKHKKFRSNEAKKVKQTQKKIAKLEEQVAEERRAAG